jgi:chromosome partitioning protein
MIKEENMLGVLTLATSKGGAGKSTLARSLAAHWLMIGHKPALVDADPQRSIANRHDATGKLGAMPVIAEPEQRVRNVIAELREQHAPVIVDTAGFRNRTSISALVASDIALIPLKPSAEDVEAAIATYELIQEINATPERKGNPLLAVMVLTMTMHGTVISRHVRSQLEAEGLPVLKAEMSNRVSYPETGIEGLSPSVVDPDGAAARDIAAIAKELMQLGEHVIMHKGTEARMRKAQDAAA